MSRWVVPQRDGVVAGEKGSPDDALGRIVKFVPAEVVSAFTLLFSVLAAMNLPADQKFWAAIALIGGLFCATIGYVLWKAPKGVARRAHLVVAPVAFLAWAYPISSSLLGSYFVGIASFGAQAVVIVLSIFITPRDG